jgi:expansin (peptidoglycan-binding protein)
MVGKLAVVALLVVLVSSFVSCTWVLGANDDDILNLFSTRQYGDGTYYGAYSSGGSCSLDPTPSWSSLTTTVAMNSPQYLDSSVCGMCAQVTGTGTGSGGDPITGTFTVYVNNKCPECASGDLDLGSNGDGRWDINWVAVACPVTGSFQYIGQNSNPYYIKLQVRNHRIPVR